MVLTVAAALPVAIWLVLLLLWGGFWRADQRLGHAVAPAAWPAVAVAIPARDEASGIGAAVRSHLFGGYPGDVTVTIADDASEDGTAALALEAAGGDPRLQVISAPALRPGWTGKLNALDAAVAAAIARQPEARWLLLTDADICHAPGTLSRLVAEAEADGLALLSVMARLDGRGVWGGLLIPAFVFFFQKLYPFALVNRRDGSVAGAAGGCVLIRRDVLEDIGGLAALRGALIDDCTLAALVKRGPPRRAIRLVLSAGEVVSLRDNRRFHTVWTMVARTAYTQLRHSPVLLALTVPGMALTYLSAPALLLAGPLHGDAAAAGLGAVGWVLMAVAYLPTLRDYGGGFVRALSLPAAAAVYAAMTVGSAVRHWRGQGGLWKGRTFSP